MARSFASSPGTTLNLVEVELQPISFSGWKPASAFSFRDVDWLVFLEDCPLPTQLLDPELVSGLEVSDPFVGLVHAVAVIHRSAVADQALPTQSQIVKHLRRMRDTVALAANLAQGVSGKGDPSLHPEWFRGEPGLEWSSDGKSAFGKRRATPAIHPVLHEILVQAEYSLANAERRTNGQDAAIWRGIAECLESLHRMPKLLERAAELAATADRGEIVPASRSKGVARAWAVSRLLWIWRDVIGEDITISLDKTEDQVERAAQVPNPCMQFIVDAMEFISPVAPHNYPAFEKYLRRTKPSVPKTPLIRS